MKSSKIKIAIAGLGNVGSGVVEIIKKDIEKIKRATSIEIEIVAVSARSSKSFIENQNIIFVDYLIKNFKDFELVKSYSKLDKKELDKIKNDFIKDIKNIKKDTIFKEVVTKKLTLWGRIKKVLTGI